MYVVMDKCNAFFFLFFLLLTAFHEHILKVKDWKVIDKCIGV